MGEKLGALADGKGEQREAGPGPGAGVEEHLTLRRPQ